MAATLKDNFLAVIPARAGSKAIKNKNTRPLANKPLFMWSVEQALASEYISKVVVSTDDDKAIDIIKNYKKNRYPGHPADWKLDYVKRPAEISGDNSPSEAALIHAVEQQARKPDYVVMLQPTSPLRLNFLIDRCIEFMIEKKADCLLTGLKLYDFFWFEGNDPFLEETTGKDTTWNWFSSYHPRERKMRQAFGRADFRYFDTGSVYITRTDILMQYKCRILNTKYLTPEGEVEGKVCVYPTSQLESIQIDSEEDFEMCERILKGTVLDAIND